MRCGHYSCRPSYLVSLVCNSLHLHGSEFGSQSMMEKRRGGGGKQKEGKEKKRGEGVEVNK